MKPTADNFKARYAYYRTSALAAQSAHDEWLADTFFALSALFLQMALQVTDRQGEVQLQPKPNPKPLQVIRLTKLAAWSAAIASGH
jgi:hypothetical protein